LTKFVGENATHFKYSAQTPEFSTFAVTASAKAEAKEEEKTTFNASSRWDSSDDCHNRPADNLQKKNETRTSQETSLQVR